MNVALNKEFEEKALEDQDACGSSQEESFDKQATLTDGPNQTVRTSSEADSGKTQDSRAAVSPSFVHHDVKLGVQEQKPQLPPSARSIVLALPAFVPLEEDQIRRERKRQLSREEDQIRRERKRQLSRESARRSSILKQKELVERYGPDAIADLLPFKPSRMSSDESHNQGSDRSQSSTDFTHQS